MAIIGINGRIGSGKDAVAKIIHRLALKKKAECGEISPQMVTSLTQIDSSICYGSGWHTKKFASKLKEIVSILTGISVADLESQEVKDSYLPACWNRWRIWMNGKYLKPYFSTKGEAMEHLAMIGIPGTIDEQRITVRTFLQEIGTEAFRDVIHPNTWVNGLFSEYNSKCNWAISDMRFPNEFHGTAHHSGITVRVVRGDVKLNDSSIHESETALDNYYKEGMFDWVIDNNGTLEDLEKEVEKNA